jgi:hypothetical protein
MKNGPADPYQRHGGPTRRRHHGTDSLSRTHGSR